MKLLLEVWWERCRSIKHVKSTGFTWFSLGSEDEPGTRSLWKTLGGNKGRYERSKDATNVAPGITARNKKLLVTQMDASSTFSGGLQVPCRSLPGHLAPILSLSQPWLLRVERPRSYWRGRTMGAASSRRRLGGLAWGRHALAWEAMAASLKGWIVLEVRNRN